MRKTVLLVVALVLSLGLNAQTLLKKAAQERDETVTINYDDGSNAPLRAEADLMPMYSLPDGYYYVGLAFTNQEFSEYYAAIIGPAYHGSAVWKNHSTGAERYIWAFCDPETPAYNPENVTWIYTADETPNMVYPAGDYLTPTLAAIRGTGDDEIGYTYNWGRDLNSEAGFGLMFCGGKAETESFDGDILSFGATNLDHHNFQLATTKFSETEYLFGSNKQNISSVGERFSKPSHPYVLEGVHIGLGKLEAPDNHVFELIIHRIENDEPVEVIARSTCSASQAYKDPYDSTISSLIFNDFEIPVLEGDDEIMLSELIIEDEILVELTNYNADGVSISVSDQKYESYYDKMTAYVYGGQPGSEKWRRCDSFKLGGKPIKTSMAVMLDLTYSYLVADKESSCTFDQNGGEATLNLISYYPHKMVKDGVVYNILEIENLPDWLEVSSTYDNESQILELTFVSEALPAGLDERSAVVRATTPGAYIDLAITQERKGTAINPPVVSEVKAVVKKESINLTYPTDYNKVCIYNTTGQEINSYTLPSTGYYTIPASGMNNGIYLLRLSGNKTETIKIQF